MSAKFCDNCGASLSDGDKFCTNCGKTIAVPQPSSKINAQDTQPINTSNIQSSSDTVEQANTIMKELFTAHGIPADADISEKSSKKEDQPVSSKAFQEEYSKNKPQASKFCSNCGKPLKVGAKFCGACGSKIN